MKAVGYRRNLPVAHDESLIDLDLPVPEPGPHDLRVAVKAVSVNPVDTKQRARATPPEGGVQVLGYDAAGVVEAVGAGVTLLPGPGALPARYASASLRRRSADVWAVAGLA